MNTTPTQQRQSRGPKIQAEIRQNVIFKYNQNLSTSHKLKEVKLLRPTVNGITKHLISESRILPKNRGGNRKTKLSEEDKFYIRNLVDVNPALTLKAVLEKLSYDRQCL
ncbi:hypothetical protein CDIK_4078 [Cucumispora dikerogammari]|nr:hypothetical protein CDIK_4078 [Cucumispora dikerogammari]